MKKGKTHQVKPLYDQGGIDAKPLPPWPQSRTKKTGPSPMSKERLDAAAQRAAKAIWLKLGIPAVLLCLFASCYPSYPVYQHRPFFGPHATVQPQLPFANQSTLKYPGLYGFGQHNHVHRYGF